LTLADYFLVIRKRWWLILLAVVSGIALAAGVNSTSTPMYQSRTSLFVSTLSAGSTSELLQSSSFSQQRVRSYADVVSSTAVLSPVIESLGLDMSPRELAVLVTASAPPNTVIIDIFVRHPEPELAREIADAIGAELAELVVSLEPAQEGGSSPVKLSVIDPATTPLFPSSPRVFQNLMIGGFSGLILGLSLAFLLEALDTRIRNERTLISLRNLPILGRFGFDSAVKKTPLIIHVDAGSPRAESFRHLRTNLEFVSAARERNSFVISSSVPSEGKSTTTINLAIAASQADQRVLLIDCDLRRPKVASYMGLASSLGLTGFLSGRTTIEEAIKQWGDGRLSVLPAGKIPPNPSELLGSKDMLRLLEWAESRWDLVLIDSPPILPATDAPLLSRKTGGLVLVVAAKKVSKAQVRLALEHIDSVGGEVVGYALNMIPTKGADAAGYGFGAKYGYGYSYQSVAAERKVAAQRPSAGPRAMTRRRTTAPERTAATKPATGSEQDVEFLEWLDQIADRPPRG
jgi:succinoglycan biosynthesis transport protein ExoP